MKRPIHLSLEATSQTVKRGEVPKLKLPIHTEGSAPERIIGLIHVPDKTVASGGTEEARSASEGSGCALACASGSEEPPGLLYEGRGPARLSGRLLRPGGDARGEAGG